MDVEQNRNELIIRPEDETDVAFLEDTLGMEEEGDALSLVRYDETVRTGFGEPKIRPKLVTERKKNGKH